MSLLGFRNIYQKQKKKRKKNGIGDWNLDLPLSLIDVLGS